MLQQYRNTISRLLFQSGGCLQHAQGLLSLLDGSSVGNGPNSERSISTTRGIYMGRVFIRENLAKSATKSRLFTRENYQYLVSNGWSLAACEQVLQNHQQARSDKQKATSAVWKALLQTISSTTTLAALQQVVADNAHRMNNVNMSAVIQQVPRVMMRSAGTPDYTGAALLLDQMASRLLPVMDQVSGPNICMDLAAFSRCRYSPSAEFLLSAFQQLQANDAQKMSHCQLPRLSMLVVALTRLVQPEGNWPVLQAVLHQTTIKLQQQLAQQQQQKEARQRLQQHMQQLDQVDSTDQQPAPAAGGPAEDQQQPQAADAAAAATAGESSRLSPEAGVGAAHETQQMSLAHRGRLSAAVAVLAFNLDQHNLHTPEFLSAVHSWVAEPENVELLQPIGLVQLWAAFRGQYTRTFKPHGQQEEEGSSSSSSSSSNTDAGEVELLAADGDAAAAQQAAAEVDSSQDSLQEQQQYLRQFFGPHTLDTLAAATVKKLPEMTTREVGQLLTYVANLRYSNPSFTAALEAAVQRLLQVQQLTAPTAMAAAWAARQLQQPRTQLLQPAILAAMTEPASFHGLMCGRLLKVTADLPSDVMQEQEQKLREELHRLSGSRGPLPDAAPGNPPWVDSIAESVSHRLLDLKPREIAHVLHCFSIIPGVQVHDNLFGAAAKHIETHAHMFTKFVDMEMVAGAFERMNYKEGLPALKALQEQTMRMPQP